MDQGGDTHQEGARQIDEQRRWVLPTLLHLRQPVRPETERRTAIRQSTGRSDEGFSRGRNVSDNQKKVVLMNFILK